LIMTYLLNNHLVFTMGATESASYFVACMASSKPHDFGTPDWINIFNQTNI
jgi:hypothetical protein